MQLTQEQSQALQEQNPLRMLDTETEKEYVLISAELYEEFIQKLLGAEDMDLDAYLPYVNELMAEDDANDPLLESYQKYRKDSE